MKIDWWLMSIIIYFGLAIATFIPVFKAILKKTDPELKEPFKDSDYFDDAQKKRLNQHYQRIQGALQFHKNKVVKFSRYHYYTLMWTIPTSIAIPILITYIQGDISRLFVTLISAFCAILLSFHKAFKVEEGYKAYRMSESAFYDVYRQFLDRPASFGDTKEKQIDQYFAVVEKVRGELRRTELDHIGNIGGTHKKINDYLGTLNQEEKQE
jgi:hypothetical protein